MRPETKKVVLMALILATIVFGLMTCLTSCQTVNLAKKSDKACKACYQYMVNNCPEILKRDTTPDTVKIYLPGKTITGLGDAKSPCEELVRNIANKDTLGKPKVPILDRKDPKTGITTKATLNTGTGQVEAETILPPTTITGIDKTPCDCIFNDEDGNLWIKAKIKGYWRDWRWWMIGITTGIIGLLILIRYLTKK